MLGGVDVDPQRIATEVAVFADRGCVDEEVTRLESHLIQLKDILDGGGQVGRKLDFLIQEMNRESNTIASKANDIQIVKATIELKSEIGKNQRTDSKIWSNSRFFAMKKRRLFIG